MQRNEGNCKKQVNKDYLQEKIKWQSIWSGIFIDEVIQKMIVKKMTKNKIFLHRQ